MQISERSPSSLGRARREMAGEPRRKHTRRTPHSTMQMFRIVIILVKRPAGMHKPYLAPNRPIPPSLHPLNLDKSCCFEQFWQGYIGCIRADSGIGSNEPGSTSKKYFKKKKKRKKKRTGPVLCEFATICTVLHNRPYPASQWQNKLFLFLPSLYLFSTRKVLTKRINCF